MSVPRSTDNPDGAIKRYELTDEGRKYYKQHAYTSRDGSRPQERLLRRASMSVAKVEELADRSRTTRSSPAATVSYTYQIEPRAVDAGRRRAARAADGGQGHQGRRRRAPCRCTRASTLRRARAGCADDGRGLNAWRGLIRFAPQLGHWLAGNLDRGQAAGGVGRHDAPAGHGRRTPPRRSSPRTCRRASAAWRRRPTAIELPDEAEARRGRATGARHAPRRGRPRDRRAQCASRIRSPRRPGATCSTPTSAARSSRWRARGSSHRRWST